MNVFLRVSIGSSILIGTTPRHTDLKPQSAGSLVCSSQTKKIGSGTTEFPHVWGPQQPLLKTHSTHLDLKKNQGPPHFPIEQPKDGLHAHHGGISIRICVHQHHITHHAIVAPISWMSIQESCFFLVVIKLIQTWESYVQMETQWEYHWIYWSDWRIGITMLF